MEPIVVGLDVKKTTSLYHMPYVYPTLLTWYEIYTRSFKVIKHFMSNNKIVLNNTIHNGSEVVLNNTKQLGPMR